LKLLIWSDSKSDMATVKIRLHNGAAFDPKDKMGTMALLADILFPTEEARQFFSEELGGSLEISTTYDYLQITATGKTDQLQAMMETLAQAVTDPPITQENFLAVRSARLEKVKSLERDPAYIADRAIAERLFGDFPYGRSLEGTTESLAKIDRVDLMFARDRFFTADNATIAVVGNVKPEFVYRAARRLFGSWRKAETKIPATFRQPEAPDTREFAIEIPDTDRYASRVAINIPSRTDKDFYAAQILTRIWQKQFCLNDETSFGKSAYKPYLLKGIFTISTNKQYAKDVESLPIYSGPCMRLLQQDGKIVYPPVLPNDFEAAKQAVISEYRQKPLSGVADLWLDVDTYRLASVRNEMSKLAGVTLAEVQRLADRLQKEPLASVVVKKPETAKQ
jgi:predicted Zn-dependent peptidase